MKKTTRILLVLLSFVMVLSLFAACAVEDDAATGNQNEASDTVATDGSPSDDPWGDYEKDEKGYIKDNIPEDLNFGDEFYILSADNQKTHFWATAEDTATVAVAIYSRNEWVANRLNIELKWDHRPCYESADKTQFAKDVEMDISSGNNFDCVVSYNLVPYRLAVKGLCENLADTPYIDLEMPWWPAEYLNTMMYKDKIFALVDNASVGTLTNLSGVFFNNDMLEDKGIQSPYELVDSNEWTLSNFRELIKETYEDTDNNQKVSEGDTFGLCTSSAARITCWYYGAGIRFSNMNAEGELELVNDVEYVSSRLDDIIRLFSTDDSWLSEKNQYTMFKEERAYFYLAILSMCTNMVNNNININYGIVPNPKYSSEQNRYYTHLPNTHDAWFLPKGVKDIECSSAFIEAMASGAYRIVNEVFFETNLKLRYAPDERLAGMYDLIRESITFDFVYIYKEVTGANGGINCDNEIVSCIKNPDANKWATKWGEIGDSVKAQFDSILEAYN